MLLAYLGLAILTSCLTDTALFMPPIKILLCIWLLTASWTNLFHAEIIPLRAYAETYLKPLQTRAKTYFPNKL
jgi:hypothetical protein